MWIVSGEAQGKKYGQFVCGFTIAAAFRRGHARSKSSSGNIVLALKYLLKYTLSHVRVLAAVTLRLYLRK